MPIDEIPHFDRQFMARLVMDLYGIEGEISPLVSYEDQNALVKTPAAKYVLKIANKKWSPSFVQAQTDVLEYLKTNAPGLTFPGVVRTLDGFGNVRPRMDNSWIDFFNPVKYPPSMAFTLMTTGGNLILLSVFSRVWEGAQRVLQPLVVFGRAPLFFYVLHLFLYAGMGYLLAPDGTSVPLVYPLWLLGLLLLFPLCLGYGEFKHRQSPGSVLRFL